jgi:hypothetical protein
MSGQALRLSEIPGAVVLLAGVTALSVAQSVSSADDIVGSTASRPAQRGGIDVDSLAGPRLPRPGS